jgi:SAM-dependent methyltransferase
MIEQARALSPDINFREGNMLGLNLEDHALAGITAFYAIVNIPREFLSTVFREMHRVLKADGLLLLAFHIGDEVLRPEELWGKAISMDFYHLRPEKIQHLLEEAGFRNRRSDRARTICARSGVPEPPCLHLRAQDCRARTAMMRMGNGDFLLSRSPLIRSSLGYNPQ